MGTLEQIHLELREHAEDCETRLPKMFVSWTWAIIMICSIVAGATALSWNASERLTKMDNRISNVEAVQSDIKIMNGKLDQIIAGQRRPVNFDRERRQ